ncbi:MAG TPA: hypothetical protein ACFE0H_12090 [Elainellaceae cyanobacterium]
MASEQDVRQYLAYWFQLGKKVMINNGHVAYRPEPIIQGDRYSTEFENCWHRIRSPESGDCYLEGTDQTVSQLLSDQWDVDPCARCGMPIPIITLGIPSSGCPCSDLPSWPNVDLPQPRSPINSRDRLSQIQSRLTRQSSGSADSSSDNN